MAEKNTASTEALKKLEEQLTCPICLEQFTNPKSFPCFHSFCLHCLEVWQKKQHLSFSNNMRMLNKSSFDEMPNYMLNWGKTH